jgi:hypothetical protein
MTKSEQINELTAALAKAQGEMGSASKSSTNPHYKSKYADLAAVWDAVRGPLSKYGLSVIQTIDGTSLTTMLCHSSGQWISGSMSLLIVKQDMQGLGSATTYARRYALSAICGVAQDDDDGNGSIGQTVTVYADQPSPGDGVLDDTYRITFGKYKQKTLEEVGPTDLGSYINYLEGKAAKDGKQIQGAVKDFIDRATNYVISWENQGETDVP